MAQSLMEKISFLFRAKFNDLIDTALRGNPIIILNQYLRDHQAAFDELQSDLIAVGGNVKTAEREVLTHQKVVAKLNDEIHNNLTDNNPGNDYLADALMVELIGEEGLLATANRTHESTQSALRALLLTSNKLQGRIKSLENQIKLLQAIQTEADIKQMTADVLIRSANIVSSGVISVEGLSEKILQNRDQSDAKFELALERIQKSGPETNTERIAAERMKQMRERLGLKETGTTNALVMEAPSLDMSAQDLKVLTATG
ncbi:PspA/IM30 family protein [Candidatus Woesebacteria bacterium]|nr:PspA/IM30 family protein [Candidatus Woesebacteria bacterium]